MASRSKDPLKTRFRYRGTRTAVETRYDPDMVTQVPIVNYLTLGDTPHLVATECIACGAKYFDRRNACAACFATDFVSGPVENSGELRSYTIVTFAAPGVPVPFVAGIVDCGGVSVRANIINTPCDPEHVTLGMRVQLATYSLGLDDDGVEAIGFGYEPIS